MSAPLLSIDGISKSFRGLRAVYRASLEVPQGSIVSLIGPNGAGKTTMFNMAAGVFRPDEGSISFDGRRIDGLRPDQICHAGIGRTFQIVKPFKELTALENVLVGALRAERDVRLARRKAEVVLDRLGMLEKRSQPAAQLTLPERKRLEVARALATDPKLLLLDEVMAGLRPTETDRMVKILVELNRSTGLTIVLIEHVMRAVMALAQRVLVLHHGAVIAQDVPSVVVRDPAVVKSYLGTEAVH